MNEPGFFKKRKIREFKVKKFKSSKEKRDPPILQDGPRHARGGLPKVVIVGNPNVGKSVLFGNLTGRYAIVSNYPGTTVEVSRGAAKIGGVEVEVIDTPGMYSLSPITEEERVARRILINEKPDLIIHVVDAKNLDRMLTLTLQLIEASFPVMLVLNIMDEAEKAGVEINIPRLGKELGIPAVGAVSTSRKGMGEIERIILEHVNGKSV